MNVEKFFDVASIDPVYYDTSYFLGPDGHAGRDVYAVLRDAIAKTGAALPSSVWSFPSANGPSPSARPMRAWSRRRCKKTAT